MGHTRDTKAWQELFGQFIEMDDHDWNAADDRLAKGCPPEKAEEILEDFVSFTRFVWSNFIDLKLDFDDHVIENIIEARGADSLESLGVRRENLNAFRP